MGGRRTPGTSRKFAWLPRVHGCGKHRRPNKVFDNIFHVFFTLQNFAFLSVAKFCVVRVSLMPGRATAKHPVDVRNPHILFCEKCKMIDLMDGQEMCGLRKLDEFRNNKFHVFSILQKIAFFFMLRTFVWLPYHCCRVGDPGWPGTCPHGFAACERKRRVSACPAPKSHQNE